MMLRLAKKQNYKECLIIFLCLLIACNLVHWKVICFGADGHIELESAFHERCEDPGHCSVPDQIILTSKSGSEICKHCGPCVDIPVYKDLVQITDTYQGLNPIFLVQTTNILTDIDNHNFSVYIHTNSTFFDTSYFTPLSSVILLV